MASILIEEQRLEDALSFLFEVCYIDLSGLSNGFNLEHLFIYEEYYFPYAKSSAKVNQHYINQILKVKHELNLTDEELKKIYIDAVGKVTLPFQLFTDDEVFEIIKCEFTNDIDELTNIYKVAESRYFSNHRKKKKKGFLRSIFKK